MAGSHSDEPLHQLWPPPGDNRITKCDVVFFHGLQLTADYTDDAWRNTWTQRGNEKVCWPEKWLPFDLGEDVRVFSFSYNAHVVNSPHDHVSEIGHNLFQALMDHRYNWHYPIVLIGYSFGGLVLKSLVVKLVKESALRNCTNSFSEDTVQRATVFLRNVKGVVFYAVPHSGSNIAEYVNTLLECCNQNLTGSWWQATLLRVNVFLRNLCELAFCGVPSVGARNFCEVLNKLLRWNIRYHPLIENIQPWKRDMEELSKEFEDIANENKINIYAFCEGRRMEQVGILVEVSSAQRSARGHFYKVEDANHFEVCKPQSEQDFSYRQLVQFIELCLEVPRECDQPLENVYDLPHAIFGMESYVERVETMVISTQSDSDPLYVGVSGMGGVGKTLLLQKVDGSRNVRRHFQGAIFIWLTVGQTPDVMALYCTLSEELGLEPKKYSNPKDYKHYLHTQLIQKRVFLVLDDVWKDKVFDSLDVAKGKGSVTLLSTRFHSLLERASPRINQVKITPLSKEDSWSLFRVHAFREPSNVPGEVEVLAQSIAEECQGLPLALKVIGRAMFGKTKPELEWEPVLKKLRQSCIQERTVVEELYECLKLGYDVLSEDDERLEDCFLYFAAFPEDHEFSFEDIFCHWVGEGWIPGKGEDDPRADAFSLLKKLCERSLIESVQLEEKYVISDEYCLAFKIHDVMRDVAFYILKNDGGVPPAKLLYLYRAGKNLKKIPQELEGTLEEPSIVRRVSLFKNKLGWVYSENLYAPELVCLLLGSNEIFGLDNSLYNFPNLRILDLSQGLFTSLPEEVGELKELVYLNLYLCTWLETIPDAVRNLRKLRCLIISSCTRLKYLPSGIVGLTSLQKFDTSFCENLRWAGQTSSLARETYADDIYAGFRDCARDCARKKYSDERTSKASIENLCELTTLTDLRIMEDVEIPHNISALRNLKIFKLQGQDLTTLPAMMGHWYLQLQQLEIGNIYTLKYLPKSFTQCGSFPALINLKIHCRSLVEFPEVENGALSKLRTLEFFLCYHLDTLPLSLSYLTSLKKLILRGCLQQLNESCMQNCEKSAIWRAPIFTSF